MLRQCNRESFWYRSLPIGAVLASVTHVAIARGLLKGSLKFGSGPKVIAASIFGYFMGKFSYAETCADKFLIEAPRSNIAQAIRRRRGLPPLEDDDTASGADEQPPGGQAFPAPLTAYSQEGETPPATAHSYEALRRRNREPPGMSLPPSSSPLPPSPPSVPFGEVPPTTTSPLYRSMPVPKGSNKYGDEGFE